MKRLAWVLKVLLSHWRWHPMQLAMLLIGLVCATALWSGVQALNQQARASYDRAAAIFGGARLAMLVGNEATFSQQLFVDLRRHGWAVSPVLENRIELESLPLRLIGIEPLTLPKEAGSASDMSPDELRDFLMPPYRTLVAPDTLRALNLKAGDRPRLKNGNMLPPLAVSGMLAPGALVVDIGVAQQALDMPDRVSRLLVASRPIGPAASLDSVTGNRLRLVGPDTESGLEQLTDSFHLNLTAFGFLAFAVGIFIVNAAIGLTFEQRLPMFRTLRACGVSLLSLNIALIIELVTLALCAGFIGLLSGYLIAAALLPDVAASLRGLYGAEIPGELVLRPVWWIAGFAMSIAGTMAASLQGFLKLNRLPVLAAAQPEAWQQVQQSWLKRQGVIAVVILTGALCALWLGTSLGAGFALLGGLLASAALALPGILSLMLIAGEWWAGRSHPGRPLLKWFWADSRQQLSGVSLALMALLLAIAVNVGVSTMVGSFRETFTGWLDRRLLVDVYLDASNDLQAADIKAWLRQESDVLAVLPGARMQATLGDQPLELFALPDYPLYRERWPLLQATPDAWDQIRNGNAAFVSEQLSRRSGLRIGDVAHLSSPGGDWLVRIVGIYADYGNPRNQMAVAYPALAKHFPQTPQTRMGLLVTPGSGPRLIGELKSRFGLNEQIADQATVRTESIRIFERTFAVTAALNAFTLGIAAMALLTNLLTLGNARLPRLAPLWALGVTLPRLSVIELLKTMSLALLTALFAIPLGVAVGWCLLAVVNVRAFGWRLPVHIFPWQLLELLGLAMAAALLATLIPVLKLFRMPSARLIKIFAEER
ncbi:MAG: ABC transporter permease [Bradyrhizobiaceae bacterium]|nr:MAG: ABC transporter permease [Bradyrhizobiaceae bacterium]